ncbi:MAG: hypothetical protein L2C94_002355 [Aigarchaeota archaeon]|nr:hypothetical protein [Candidatus Wolframiiraptor gerlachensis]
MVRSAFMGLVRNELQECYVSESIIRDALREGHEVLIRCISEWVNWCRGRGSFGDYSRQV